MRKNTLGTLTGILLATAPITLNNCAPERQTLNSNYSVSVKDLNLNKDQYKAEGVVFFDKTRNAEGYYMSPNKDIDNGELSFVISPQNQTNISFDIHRGTDMSGKEYIPTLVTYDEKIITKFKITDPEVKARLSRKLKDKSRTISSNSFGHSYEINEKDIKAIFPETTINGEDYAYIKAYQGEFLIEGQKENERHFLDVNPERLNLLLMPINQEFKIYTNLKTGEMILEAQKIYNPITKTLQEEVTLGKKLDKSYLEGMVGSSKNNSRQEKQIEYFKYQVQKGDTEWSISEKFLGTGKNYHELEKANPGLNQKNLKAGQIIKVPKN